MAAHTRLLLVVVSLLCLSGLCTGQDAEEHFPPDVWSRLDIPNPQTQPEKCGRNGPSYVCDPNHILTEYEAEYLDTLIEEIRDIGGCQCDTDIYSCPRNPNYGGFHAAVCIVDKIELSDTASDVKKIATATWYADYLRRDWDFGSCEDNLVLFVSTNDKVVYTKVGHSARVVLSDDCVDKIFEDNSQHFSYGDYGEGIVEMLEGYKAIFLGEKSCSEPRVGLWVFLGVAGALVLVIILLIVLRFCGCMECKGGGGGGSSSYHHGHSWGHDWGGGGGGGGGGSSGGGGGTWD